MENVIIGYSGHAYVVCDIIYSNGQKVVAYFDKEEKEYNPYELKYLGREQEGGFVEKLEGRPWFVAIGDNGLREKIITYLLGKGIDSPQTIVHKRAIVSTQVYIGYGTMVAAGVMVNAFAKIGNGVICNTGSVIEHECVIGDFAHIAPGAVLAGNVRIGNGTFVGANAVIKEGIKIGEKVCIGAGCVVLRDVDDGMTIIGNPGRIVNK